MTPPGPPPKPTTIRILEGNPSRRPLPEHEPRPETGIPTRPEWLDPEAKREWARVCGELDRIGLLTKVDRAALSGYCQAWADFVDCVRIIRERGRSYVNDKGDPKTLPEVTQAQNYLRIIRGFCAEFGLTPSARGRMTLPGQRDEDELEKLIAESH